MEFTKYMHIERLGTDEVDGILDGKCYVFPKIDGTNASVWWDGETVMAGSRNRELSPGSDNAGFCAWAINQQNLYDFLSQNQKMTLYGEWLVPHSLRTYRDDTWRNFYVFDIFDHRDGKFVPYDEYAPVLDDFGIQYIPLMETVTNATDEHLLMLMKRNTYLLQDGKGFGEGIVIKRYDFVNRYGRTKWAKLVSNEFKEEKGKVWDLGDVNMLTLEIKIAQEYVTTGRADKLLEKMRETGQLTSKRIPEYLGRMQHEIINDEMWNIIKKHKQPKIDFRRLNRAITQQAKLVAPTLFGKQVSTSVRNLDASGH